MGVGVGDELGREDFEGDLAVELQIERLVDNPHPATADLFDDLVVGEGTADQSFWSVTKSMTQISLSFSPHTK